MTSIDFTYLPVPQGDTKVYNLAEMYFVNRLTANFRPKGYECYLEYEYAGGRTVMPVIPFAGHLDPAKARILEMLQGGYDSYGFRTTKPKTTPGKAKESGFQKPDFLAFTAHRGVVGEIGTAAMRSEKQRQLNGRIRDLQRLVDAGALAHTYESIGQPVQWSGMNWYAADYHPEEGAVLIPVDDDRVISTHPTFVQKQPGLYLYQLLRYRRHRMRIGVPVRLPQFAPATEKELQEAWRRYQQPVVPKPGSDPRPHPDRAGWLNGWPSLRDQLLPMVKLLGLAVVVIAAVVVVVAAAPAVAAGASIAGFAAALAAGLIAPVASTPAVPLA